MLPVALGVAGGLLGAIGSKGGKSTQTTGLPEWQLPYVQSLLSQVSGARAGIGNETPVLGPAQNEYMKTLGGGYLTPESNPFLKDTFDAASRGVADVYKNTVQPRTDSMFFGPGSMGGNTAYQGQVARNNWSFGQNLTDLAANIYGGNYSQERNRQFAATQGAPQFQGGQYQAAYSPYSSYLDVVGRPFGQQTTQQMQGNPVAGLLGGALGGYTFGKMMGT